MILVHEADLQGIEDFLDWWVRGSKKSMPNLAIVEARATELRKRCDAARRGYPAGTLPKDPAQVTEGGERVMQKCEVDGCNNQTYAQRCWQHAERKTKKTGIF